MMRVLTVALAIFLTSGPAPAKTRKPKPAAFVQSAAPAYQFSFANEADAENQLLALANHVRAEAGVPPLQWDEGLTRAAREHAAAMAAQQQLSHQFSSEASVHQRLTAATPLHLDRAGENVAYAATVDEVHDNLMHSPPHPMAQADSLNVSSNPGQYFLRYSIMQPEVLPGNAAKTVADRGLRAFAVGACYSRTASYPGGVYWIAVVFY